MCFEIFMLASFIYLCNYTIPVIKKACEHNPLWFVTQKRFAQKVLTRTNPHIHLCLRTKMSKSWQQHLFSGRELRTSDYVCSHQLPQKHSLAGCINRKVPCSMKRARHKRKDKIRRCVFWKLTTTRISSGSAAVTRSASELFTFSTMQISCV